ncbi:MAG: hypothetical protein ABIO83_08645 [Ilumatobacteraceae bacterium]
MLEAGMWAVTLDTNSVWYYTGTVWKPKSTPWTAYTPAWTNLTLNSGTVDSARYRYQDGDMRVRGQVTFAADSVIAGTVSQTLPDGVTSDTGWTGGVGLARDNSGNVFDTLVIGITPGVLAFSWVCSKSGLPLGNVEPFAGTFGQVSDQLTWDFLVAVA